MAGRKGFFVLCGAPGTWKTTSALMTFQNALYIASAENLDQFYHEWLKSPEGIASKKQPITRIVTLDQYSLNGAPVSFDKDGDMIRIPQKENFEDIIVDVTKALSMDKAAGKPPRFRNVIVDEASVFWQRFYVEIKREMTVGRDVMGRPIEKNGDGRAHHYALQMWTREVIDRFRTIVTMGANLVVVAHLTEPEGGGKKGGPQMPNKNLSGILGADSHGCLIADFEETALGLGPKTGPKHLWKIFASSQWTSKMRGISADRFEEVKYWDLERIICEAGFEP